MSKKEISIILCSDIVKQGYLPSYFNFRLERNGFDIQYLAYPSLKKDVSIDQIAQMHLDWARDIRNKSTKSIFIGHGLGGRIGLAMLKYDPVVFDAIVTIATPYMASPTIVSLGDIGAIQGILKAISPLVLELRKDANLPEKLVIPSLSLAAQFDHVLAPHATANIIDDHTIIPTCGHNSILTKERTYLEILGWINYAVCGSVKPPRYEDTKL